MTDSQAPLLPPPGLRERLIRNRHGGLVLFFGVFVAVSFLTRGALLLKAAHDVTWSPGLLAAFGWGMVFDLGPACFASLPLIVLLTVLPAGAFQRPFMRLFAHRLSS